MGQGRFGGWWYLGALGSLPPAPAPSPWGTTLPPPPPSYFTLKLGWAEGEGCSRGGEGGPPGVPVTPLLLCGVPGQGGLAWGCTVSSSWGGERVTVPQWARTHPGWS